MHRCQTKALQRQVKLPLEKVLRVTKAKRKAVKVIAPMNFKVWCIKANSKLKFWVEQRQIYYSVTCTSMLDHQLALYQ